MVNDLDNINDIEDLTPEQRSTMSPGHVLHYVSGYRFEAYAELTEQWMRDDYEKTALAFLAAMKTQEGGKS